MIIIILSSASKAGHQLDKRSIRAISYAYSDTSWRGDISWYPRNADVGKNALDSCLVLYSSKSSV